MFLLDVLCAAWPHEGVCRAREILMALRLEVAKHQD